MYVPYFTAAFLHGTSFLLCNSLALIILIRKYVCKPMNTGHQPKQHCEIIFKGDGQVIVK